MADVCIGTASLKWRTNSVSPKDVQPCGPCKSGIAPRRPRKANEPPIGWLILSGLTEQALFEVVTIAMSSPYSAACSAGGCRSELMSLQATHRAVDLVHGLAGLARFGPCAAIALSPPLASLSLEELIVLTPFLLASRT